MAMSQLCRDRHRAATSRGLLPAEPAQRRWSPLPTGYKCHAASACQLSLLRTARAASHCPPSALTAANEVSRGLRPRPRRCIPTRASSTALQYRRYGSPSNRPQSWQVASGVCGVAMLLCNFHRSVFTALLPLLAEGLALRPAEVGLLQSSMLWGYLAGQIPAGRLADEMGGDRVLLASCGLWSLATAATAAGAAASPAAALPVLLAARAAMGLASSSIMPAVSAATAQWVPPERKAGTQAMIYAFFNLGGVLGLIVAPHLATRSGWPAAFVTAAAGGLMWAALGSAAVARAGPRPAARPAPPKQLLPPPAGEAAAGTGTAGSAAAAAGALPSPQAGSAAGAAEAGRGGAVPSDGGRDADEGAREARRKRTIVQVAVLCWCHGVIGWGFFVLQAWLPMYLQSLGVGSVANAGLLASLPWLAAALTGTAAAGFADRVIRGASSPSSPSSSPSSSTPAIAPPSTSAPAPPCGGRPPPSPSRLSVRRAMHAVSTLGCAAAMAPLALAPSGGLPPAAATACLVAAVGCYGASFGGFHAYVQDVAAADAGKLLGLTNTASILGGIAGNLATGALLQATGGYGGVFGVAAALYLTSWAAFTGLLRGERLALDDLRGPAARG